MKKENYRIRKLQLACGQARPGANLASLNINMPFFCREFNERTKNEPAEKIVNVYLLIFPDKTCQFTIKSSPTANLIKKISGSEKKISPADLRKIAQEKLVDLN